MCCFTRTVQEVADTRIFARPDGDGARQVLVYAMRLSADEELAMVLPLPTPPSAAEDALAFVDLAGYPTLFDDLARAFPTPRGPAEGQSWDGQGPGNSKALEVHRVGAFDASFVPHRRDFARLDARFRLPAAAWDDMDDYDDWGFAVFKLRAGEAQAVHPMAFRFPTRRRDAIFFPTVHVHDGTRPARATFDHLLYAQIPEGRRPGGDFARTWTESPELARGVVDLERAQGLVVGDRHLHRIAIAGERPNEDQLVLLT